MTRTPRAPRGKGFFSIKLTRRSQKLWDDWSENAIKRSKKVRGLLLMHMAETLRLRLVETAPEIHHPSAPDGHPGFDYASRIRVVIIQGTGPGSDAIALTMPVESDGEWRDEVIKLRLKIVDMQTVVLRAEFGFGEQSAPAWRPALESLKGLRPEFAALVVEYVARGRNRFLRPAVVDRIQASSVTPETNMARRLKVSFSL